MPSNEQRREAAKRKLERQLANRAERARKRRIFGVVGTVAGVVLVVGLIYWLANRSGDDTIDPAASTAPTTEPAPDQVATPANIPTELAAVPKRPTALPAKATCAYPVEEGKPASKPAQAPPTDNVSAEGTIAATIGMSVGDVKITLDRALAPCTVNSFVSLAKQGYFNDTTCHRLTTEGIQVLQCGDPTAKGSGGPGYSFDDEVFPEIKYGRGILAMANAGKNPQTNKGTNGSQFFIVYGNAELPPNYTVFGTVEAESLKKIDEIAKTGTVSQGAPGDGSPKNPVAIKTVTVA
ncbi:Probable peptidyl-prolyl cis-trans isomerase B (PPIase B) (Rotamase B) [Alloactinosynnema sp. L-07]|uniref:peptidylprolyl isomerase n=1 Tax=Alloactinosynnema sp. L-07 TaxID=1653480 RepID=UPI00065EF156|nr:peptidylprolyl isomerase [Alloactinosynnema sp. L-07]CRK58107.1 Probable peptidyl-prolyl cis-trans isomerase B (PPIase B) (Rotamase B) [Alloactinosynnema sp. L-07]